MAVPTFRAAGAATPAAQTASPPLPAGMSAGDVCLLVATCPTANTVSLTVNGSVGTWTLISGLPVTVAAGEKLYVWWGRWQSGTTAPTVQASVSDVINSIVVAYSGVIDVGNVIDVATTGSEATSDTSFSFAPGSSTTRNNCMAVCVATILRDSNVASVPVMTNASLTSLASRANTCTNTGAGGGFGMSEGAKATAGTLGTWACTYAAASPKSYVTFALIGGKSGVSDTPLTIAIVSAGVRKTFGATTTPLTVGTVTTGVRTRLGASATPLTVSVVTSGVRTRLGATAVPLTVTIASAGDVTAGQILGSADLALTATFASAGVRTRLGASNAPITVGTNTAGTVTRFGASATALTFNTASAAVVTRFGTSSFPLSLSVTSSAFKSTTGASSVVTVVTISTAAYVGTFGSSSLPLTVGENTSGIRGTFATTDSTTTVNTSTTGSRATFGTVTFPITLDIFTASGGTFGAAALDMTVGLDTAGTQGSFSSASAGLSFGGTAAGTRTTFASSHTPISINATTAGYLGHFATTTLPLTLAVLTIPEGVGGDVIVGGIDFPDTDTVISQSRNVGIDNGSSGSISKTSKASIA